MSRPALLHRLRRFTRQRGCRIALIAAGVATLSMFATAAEHAGNPAEDRVSQVALQRMERDGVPGVVLTLIEDGVPVWTNALGTADEETGRQLTKEAVFRVESLSKPVTAWAAMLLAETGRLDLDAPATDCLRRWRPPAGTPVFTARQLLSHTASLGLGSFAERYPPGAARPDLPSHLARDFRMIATPGAGFSYSDTGFNLLELLIEDCSGEDFATLMAREVFGPLGMDTATYDWPGPGMPVGHDLRGRPVAAYVYPGRGSGGLLATADDIARFALASMDPGRQTVLSADSIAALHEPATQVKGLFGFAADGYALGHFTETLSDGRESVWHGGQGYGWMTHMHMVPETGDGIVILANSQRAWPLIAAVLEVWSDGIGVAPVGMSRVLMADGAARLAIALLLAVTLLATYGAASGRKVSVSLRVTAGVAGVPLIAWPIWVALQDYAFLFSILPGLWPWLAAASAASGLVLLVFSVSRLWPR